MIPLCLLLASGALAQSLNSTADPPAKTPAVQSPQVSQREALEKQKASIRLQARSAGVHLMPWHAQEPDCDPLAESEVQPIIESAAQTRKVAPELIRAVIEQESAFRPCAVSPKGAQGLMQLMPATADQLGVRDAFDPKTNIDAGTQFLKQLMDKYGGDLAKTLGAYNAGAAAVDEAGGIPDIPETRDYVDAILKKLDPKRIAPPSIPTPKPIEN